MQPQTTVFSTKFHSHQPSTTQQIHDNSHHQAPFVNTPVRPHFRSAFYQNSSSLTSSSHSQSTKMHENSHYQTPVHNTPVRPHFPSTVCQNSSSSTSSSHSKSLLFQPTTSSLLDHDPLLHDHSNYQSSFLHTAVRPSFCSTICQNSSSTASSSHSQSLRSQPTTSSLPDHEAILHRASSSSSSALDHEQYPINEYEKRLLKEVEIADEQGNILKIQKMTTKDVFKLKPGERILVHVNELYQPIKAAGGLCTRFMTLLLKEPNLCPPGARDWREVKLCCGIRLLVELRRRFTLPHLDCVDKVLFSIFDVKFRTIKYQLKKNLFSMASEKLSELEDGVPERDYTEDELLQALDLLQDPLSFVGHKWELYKSHLRTPLAKKLSQDGKKARTEQVHSHTTGALSYARKKDEFNLKHKRDAYEVEWFEVCYLTKDGSYVGDMSRELVVRAREEVSKKILEVSNVEQQLEVDPAQQSEIERDVMQELMGPDKPGRARGHGAGVTKSQVTKFSCDLRKSRGEVLTNQNRYLLDKVDCQSKKIESQSVQIESQNVQLEAQRKQIESQSTQMTMMKQKIDKFTSELQIFHTAFDGIYGPRTSKDRFFTTPLVTREDIRSPQLGSGASRKNCQ